MRNFNSTKVNDNVLNGLILVIRLFVGISMLTHALPKFEKLIANDNIEFINFLGLGSAISLVLVVFAELLCSVFIIFWIHYKACCNTFNDNNACCVFCRSWFRFLCGKRIEFGLLFLLLGNLGFRVWKIFFGLAIFQKRSVVLVKPLREIIFDNHPKILPQKKNQCRSDDSLHCEKNNPANAKFFQQTFPLR